MTSVFGLFDLPIWVLRTSFDYRKWSVVEGYCRVRYQMAEVFDDETEQTISIQEYLKEVEEQELVTHSLPLFE